MHTHCQLSLRRNHFRLRFLARLKQGTSILYSHRIQLHLTTLHIGQAAIVKSIQIIGSHLDANILACLLQIGRSGLKGELIGFNLVLGTEARKEIHIGIHPKIGGRSIDASVRIGVHIRRTAKRPTLTDTGTHIGQIVHLGGVQRNLLILDRKSSLNNGIVVLQSIVHAIIQRHSLPLSHCSDGSQHAAQ